ncbi:MAG: periplasmic solute binding protein [Proteobacteria bacterium]|nr:periplasmic solute binding protein [Pseudomonadota bacterium]
MNRLFLASLLAVLAASSALATDRLPVVASFSILGDMVSRVGGDRVAVAALVGPDGDAHVYEPTPDDIKAVAGAKLLVVNGLGFEGWMDRLAEASGYKGPVTVASNGVIPRKMAEEEGGHNDADASSHADQAHQGIDPHAWQDVANAVTYVKNIAAGLDTADPQGKAMYDANAAAYIAELEALDAEARSTMAALPADRRKIITSHDAFGYFGAAYGLTLLAPEGMSTESEASAADVARIIRQIRDDAIPAIFVENIKDRRMIDQIAAETHAVVGGELYTDALSAKDGPAPTYVDMIRHNIGTLTEALAPKR